MGQDFARNETAHLFAKLFMGCGKDGTGNHATPHGVLVTLLPGDCDDAWARCPGKRHPRIAAPITSAARETVLEFGHPFALASADGGNSNH
jgi:hypothetical protein